MPDPFGYEPGQYLDFEEITGEMQEATRYFGDMLRQEADALKQTMASARGASAGAAGTAQAVGGGRVFANVAEFDAWAQAAYTRAARTSSAAVRQAAPPATGGGTPGGGGGFRGWWATLGGITPGKEGEDRGSIYGLWRARAIQQTGDQIKRLGERLQDTARGWADYANEADRAQEVMDRLAESTGGVTFALKEQLDPASRLSMELGEHLIPYYEEMERAGDSLKTSLAEASDGLQAVVATGTLAAGTFLKVSGGAVAALGGLAALKVLSASVASILGIQATATMSAATVLGVYAGGLGGIAALYTVGFAATSAYLAQLRVLESDVLKTTQTYDEYIDSLRSVPEEYAILDAAMSGTGIVMDFQLEQVAKTADEWATARVELEKYGASLANLSAKSIERASAAAYAMTPAFAGLFGQSAAAQEDIQNEIETKQRRHAYITEQLVKFGYDKQLVAQADALDAQIQQQEVAMMKLKEATRSGVGSLVIQWIQAAVDLGRLDFFQGIEMQLDVMGKMQGVSPEDIELARQASGQLQAFATGEQTWGQTTTRLGWTTTEALGGAMANLPAINADTVALTATTVVLEGPVYISPEAMKDWGAISDSRTAADELRTQGVRTR